ncbi:hypothetical protein ElyMa_001635600 [Elysia marginata]|uniref:Fibronectin type-III domain-containing protein n=1 Tax=Elysia marginata TaxID=1093978 RepID=A0AAV4JQN7_9GAST|nr:hypothetical protein ElyMa_001635600 [Elysia marginata]
MSLSLGQDVLKMLGAPKQEMSVGVDDFKVRGIGSSETTDSISLTWTANDYGLNVDYSISVQPQPASANIRGGTVNGLQPGTTYTFTITSTIPAYSVYAQREVTETYTATTGGLDSSVGKGLAPWPRGRWFESQPSTVRAPIGWVGVSII